MSTLKKIVIWIAILGGGVGFFFATDIIAQFMR